MADAASDSLVRILLVEDDGNDARLLEAQLARSQDPAFRVTHVKSVAEAREEAGTRRFDLALLDLGLPDARELEGLEALREAAPSLPVVVVTGRAETELAATALYRGAEDYLTKGDFDGELLIRAIRYAIERHRGRHDLALMSRELATVNQRLQSLLVVDPLTEVLNRRGIEQALEAAVERHAREGAFHAALFIDLDHFKQVNDRWGHAVGDQVLCEVASKLRESARAGDAVGRTGGDEFLVVVALKDPGELSRVAERVRLSIGSMSVGSGLSTLAVTACVAATLLRPEFRMLENLLGEMHALLHEAKSSGRNCVAVESGQADGPTPADLVCEDLRRGRGVYAVLQPIMNLATMRVCGFELLSRFRSGGQGPDSVFRLCAERNMLSIADHHCLRTCVELSTSLPAGIRRHVNIFPSTLMGTSPQQIIELFPRQQRNLFCVELSEQQMLGETRGLQDRVASLKSAGIQIACDDVGFGRSHLESLVLLEPDIIKLDKRCVRGVSTEKRGRRQLERFIAVAHKLGAVVVAEGIETDGELQVLRSMGVDQGQGYLWGVPGVEMPVAVGH